MKHRFIQFGQPPGRNLANQHALPERFRSKRVVHKAPDDGGYALTLSCGHQLWVPLDPGDHFYCGACLVGLIARERAVFQRALGYTLRRHSCDLVFQRDSRHGGDVR